MTIIQNGKVFWQGDFFPMDLAISGDTISHLRDCPGGDTVIDAHDLFIIPGFVDIHIHGAMGSDFCDGTEAALSAMAGYLASVGVTAFLGTSMAFDEEILAPIFRTAARYGEQRRPGEARLAGINMEGPFFSKAKRGAQAERYISDPDPALFMRLYRESGETIRLLDIAPELPGALDLIREAARVCTVSLAHTQADYDTALRAFEAGAGHVTHLFNAMPPFSHRAPGPIGAAVEMAGTVELICDGVHLHPAVVRTAFRLFGKERICLISDAMRACGMPDGEYNLGGQRVYVSGKRAKLADGTIAGSCTPLSECVRQAIGFGIAPEDAIYSATATPAKRAGIWDTAGSIEVGKLADLVLLNGDYTVNRVILGEGNILTPHL